MKFTNHYFYRYFLTDGSRFRNFSKNENNTVNVERSGKLLTTILNSLIKSHEVSRSTTASKVHAFEKDTIYFDVHIQMLLVVIQ